jgi:hypothetical protein
MDHISRIIPTVLSEKGLAKHASCAYTIQKAREWIIKTHPKIYASIQVISYSKGILTISCDNMTAFTVCNKTKQDLAAELNIKQIRLKRA